EPDVVQADPVEAADDVELVGSECEAVPPEHPLDADQAEDEKAVHDGRQHVLPADQPAVEETKRWRHQHHERSRCQDPGGIAAIDLHLWGLSDSRSPDVMDQRYRNSGRISCAGHKKRLAWFFDLG